MAEALAQARRAWEAGEVPIGAVVAIDGEIVGRGFNQPIGAADPTAHAEVVAIRDAARRVGNYRLTGATLCVTVEPCLMCVGALVHARIATLVYGAAELRTGAVVSTIRAADLPGHNHRVAVVSGVREGECRGLMQDFFQDKRGAATMAGDLSYPIGTFDRHAGTTAETRRAAIEDIATLSAKMRAAVSDLSDAQLDTAYRPGGWTVRQLVHHVADSHMNGYIRLKLALTEDRPTIKPYEQDPWAGLPDSRLPITASLAILDGVHERWTVLWRSAGEQELARTFNHPELGTLTVDTHLHLYAWHSRHHVAHVTALRRREGW